MKTTLGYSGGAVAFDATVPHPFGQPVSVSGVDFRLKAISDDYCGILQRSREELINMDWQGLVHADDLAGPAHNQAILIATGKPYDVQCRVRRADGKWLRGNFHATRVDLGRKRGYMIQSFARFEEIAPPALPDVGGPNSETALFEYIQILATELARLAQHHRLEMLQYLLSMVSHEAAEQLQRQLHPLIQSDLPDRVN